MENKRIILIGGTGYIGSVVASTLSNKSYDVSVLS